MCYYLSLHWHYICAIAYTGFRLYVINMKYKFRKSYKYAHYGVVSGFHIVQKNGVFIFLIS